MADETTDWQSELSVRAAMWAVHAAALAWFVLAFWAFSDVELGLVPGVAVAVSVLFMASIWLVAAVAATVLAVSGRLALATMPWGVRLGLVSIPLAGAALWAAVSEDLPFRTRLALSESELTAFVESRVADGHSLDGRQRVGLFEVTSSNVVDGCVRMVMKRGFPSETGLVWCDHMPPQIREDSYDHVTGPWWRWSRRF